MTYSLPIYEHSHDDRSARANVRKAWWANFTKTIREEKFGTGFKFFTDQWFDLRTEVLASYNAEYRDGCVHFASEADAAFFLLRWS